MNKIKLDLGLGYEPTLKIYIDDIDFFTMKEFRNEFRVAEEDKSEFKPTYLSNFLFNEWEHRDLLYLDNPEKMPKENDVFNGIMLIGVCNLCGCEGCGDLIVKIVTDKNITTWNTYGKEYVFDAIEYKNEIQKLTDNYYSYSWEDERHKINRIITEYIIKLKTKNRKNKNMVGNNISTDVSNDIIEIFYYDEPPNEERKWAHRKWMIKWDNKSIEADHNLTNELIWGKKPLIKKKLVGSSGVVIKINKNVLQNNI